MPCRWFGPALGPEACPHPVSELFTFRIWASPSLIQRISAFLTLKTLYPHHQPSFTFVKRHEALKSQTSSGISHIGGRQIYGLAL